MTARRAPVALATLALGFCLTACTSTVGGQANPSSTGSTPTSTTADPADPFAGLSACTILDQALAGQGFPQAVPGVAAPEHSCRTSKPTSGDTPGIDLGLVLQAGGNYRDNVNNPDKASDGKVNGRPAIEEQEPLRAKGQCAIRFQVRNSRALFSLTYGSDTATACKKIEELAPKVEPLLPKNN
ncbi:DUF3558 family protein [Amycolatopsis sp. OK19-0408]|uniref:DUF3558 family protein n=1 Tax=Amycolatopsis iheyensis TaxID=2945988 RepID=A0A9X2NB26_9PSEU|nr:DUF3558 family protein [Amycolatopsis iheyensis]MCR6484273.1 DUF3558 family protein [Amycolatopsis iheyensis]